MSNGSDKFSKRDFNDAKRKARRQLENGTAKFEDIDKAIIKNRIKLKKEGKKVPPDITTKCRVIYLANKILQEGKKPQFDK